MSDDLAEQLAKASRESKAGKRVHMTDSEILDQYFSGLVAKR